MQGEREEGRRFPVGRKRSRGSPDWGTSETLRRFREGGRRVGIRGFYFGGRRRWHPRQDLSSRALGTEGGEKRRFPKKPNVRDLRPFTLA